MQVKDLLFDGQSVDGEIGIEIEIEGHLPPLGAVLDESGVKGIWRYEHDGSLRGDSCELVFQKPLNRDEINPALGNLMVAWDEFDGEIVPSVRTGVHIHVNVRDLTLKQTYIFMILFFLFEDALVRYCGEDRTGNLFCRRASDAEMYIDELVDAIQENDPTILYTDELRYAAMNPKAIKEYGSLEFRCLKTPENLLEIERWVKLLLCLKDAALKITDPVEVIEGISMRGGEELAEFVFNGMQHYLDVSDWTREIFKAIRLIQPAVYARDWNKPDPEPVILDVELPQDYKEAWERGILTGREVVEWRL